MATHAQSLRFDSSCRRCERLASHLDTVRAEYPDYYAQPVPSFGEAGVRLLIVGLAPGKHGANATGRPFTGDHAGILLYQTLHKFGFASQPVGSSVDDGLHLIDCRITNAVRCLPPGNKPTTGEIDTCNAYLAGELAAMPRPGIIVALGTVAHRATLKALGLRLSAYPFGHGAEHPLDDGLRLIDSYHCSRYNTQTRRLTAVMFEDIFRTVQQHLAP